MLTAPRALPAESRDQGFTLIELVLSIGILGVVFGAMALVMVSALRAEQETEERLTLTRDEQFLAAYLAGDVAGTTEVVSGQASRCGGGNAVLELRGASFSSAVPPADTLTLASYVLTATTVDGVATGTLARRTCEVPAGTTAFPAAPTRAVVVARSLATTAPAVVCRTGSAVAACSADTTDVSVTLTRRDGTTFVLSATRRTTP